MGVVNSSPDPMPSSRPFRFLALSRPLLLATAPARAQQFRDYQVIAVQSQPAPGLPGARYGFLDMPVIGPNGHIAFHALLSDNGSANSAIWTGLPGAMQLLAVKRDVAPDSSGRTYDGFAVNDLRVDAEGNVAFQSRLDDILGPDAVFIGAPGEVRPVAIESEPAAGIAGGVLDRLLS